jgi:hypothetical protein
LTTFAPGTVRVPQSRRGHGVRCRYVDQKRPRILEDLIKQVNEGSGDRQELLENALQSLDSPEFDDIFAEFVEVVTQHVETEETEVLPALRDAVDPATLDRLGAAFARVRADEPRKAGYDDEYEHSAAYDRGADDANRDETSWALREHH